jgi:long-chain acyl-CoA synthetase
MQWFTRDDLLDTWLQDFIQSQMRQLRPDFSLREPLFANTLLNSAAVGIDSIEWVELASALFIALDAEGSGALAEHATQNARLGARYGQWLGFSQIAAGKTDTLYFQTSGSTGAARWHAHRMENLLREVREVAALLQLDETQQRRIVSVMPAHHIYGFLFGVLLPSAMRWPALHVRQAAPAQIRVALQPGDIVLGHPQFWRGALAAGAWPAGIIGLSAGQALPAASFEAAVAAGLARMFEIYGATETAGIGWRDVPTSFHCFSRYRQQEGSLLDAWQQPERLVMAPDQLLWSGDTFSVGARHDQMVQVAAQNVSISHVENILRGFPGVQELRVRLFAAPGSASARLHAFVVPQQIDLSALRAYAVQKLEPAARPQTFTMGDQLPSNAAGKACDWLVQAASD